MLFRSNGTYTTVYLKYNTGWYSNSGGTNSISSMSIPSKTGYDFLGFYTSSSGGTQIINSSGTFLTTSSALTFTASNTTLYAHWTPKILTISLNGNGATSNGTTTIYLKYNTGWYSNSGATTSISSVTIPSRTGYIFNGFYTSTSGGTQIINSSGSINSGNLTFRSSNGTLYAQWTPITYNIS